MKKNNQLRKMVIHVRTVIDYILRSLTFSLIITGGRRCHDRMVVGFTTTYAISAYHH
jgi:hypothetical protein